MKWSEIHRLLESMWDDLVAIDKLLSQCNDHEVARILQDMSKKIQKAASGMNAILGLDWELTIPPLDTSNGEWITQTEVERKFGIKKNSLRTMRSAGQKQSRDKTVGIDKAGRFWRKESESSHKVYYYKPRLPLP